MVGEGRGTYYTFRFHSYAKKGGKPDTKGTGPFGEDGGKKGEKRYYTTYALSENEFSPRRLGNGACNTVTGPFC